MEHREISVKKNWQVKACISDREEHLFYRAVRTKVGAKYTPLCCSSKILANNRVSFFILAVCEYITDPVVMQYVTVQYDVLDGTLQEPTIKVVGPEEVDFKLHF